MYILLVMHWYLQTYEEGGGGGGGRVELWQPKFWAGIELHRSFENKILTWLRFLIWASIGCLHWPNTYTFYCIQ